MGTRRRVRTIAFGPRDAAEFAGVAAGQRVQDQSIENRKNRGVGADTEGKSQHDERDEDGALAHTARGVTDVAPEAGEPAAEAGVAGGHGIVSRQAVRARGCWSGWTRSSSAATWR